MLCDIFEVEALRVWPFESRPLNPIVAGPARSSLAGPLCLRLVHDPLRLFRGSLRRSGSRLRAGVFFANGAWMWQPAISAVPEPATWALFILGFGGWVRRSFRQ